MSKHVHRAHVHTHTQAGTPAHRRTAQMRWNYPSKGFQNLARRLHLGQLIDPDPGGCFMHAWLLGVCVSCVTSSQLKRSLSSRSPLVEYAATSRRRWSAVYLAACNTIKSSLRSCALTSGRLKPSTHLSLDRSRSTHHLFCVRSGSYVTCRHEMLHRTCILTVVQYRPNLGTRCLSRNHVHPQHLVLTTG